MLLHSTPLMGSSLPLALSLVFLSLSAAAVAAAAAAAENKTEIETHLHFYFHDIVTASNPTAIRVASAPLLSTTLTGFGAVVVVDDPLTEGPDEGSRLVGRAQGFYALASREEAGLLMTMNFAFVDGEYNGSTLAVLGRNAVFSGVREMPIVGGSGKFRFARGYALAKTYYLNLLTGNAIVEYDVFVLHQ